MSPDRDSRFSPADEHDEDFEDDAPRSIFAATWFRVVLVVLVLGVIGAVAVPFVLDIAHDGAKTASAPPAAPAVTSPPPAPSAAARPAMPPPAATPPAAGPSPAVSTPAPAPPPKPPAVVAQATKPEATKPEPSAPPAKKEPPKAQAAESPPAVKAPAATDKSARPAPTRAKVAEGGDYFVQVGAFKDAETARRVATRLREQNYPVDESVKRSAAAATSSPSAAPRPAPRAASPGGTDRYDVIVSGGTASEINTKLAGKGLASEPVGDGMRIRPSLSLRDAVALSKDLSNEGFKVQVRRGGGASAEVAPAAPAPLPASETGGLYRVRVGGYADRATALTVLRELKDKGYQPFIAKGRE